MFCKLFNSHNQNSEGLLYKQPTGLVRVWDLYGQGYQRKSDGCRFKAAQVQSWNFFSFLQLFKHTLFNILNRL